MKIAISVSDKEKAKGNESPYFKALVGAGARPDELELVAPPDVAAGAVDGVLFAGGEDVDPEFYDERKKYENVHVNRARDEFELALLDRALAAQLPILGICRGSQVINVKFGGSLYQDLQRDYTDLEREHRQQGSRGETTHGVTVTDSESHLGHLLRAGSCRVNSLHHQAIKRLGRGLKVTAHSEDGLVEAVEAADEYPFLLAVQWHPEEIADRPEERRIFERFLEKCREHAENTRPGSGVGNR